MTILFLSLERRSNHTADVPVLVPTLSDFAKSSLPVAQRHKHTLLVRQRQEVRALTFRDRMMRDQFKETGDYRESFGQEVVERNGEFLWSSPFWVHDGPFLDASGWKGQPKVEDVGYVILYSPFKITSAQITRTI